MLPKRGLVSSKAWLPAMCFAASWATNCAWIENRVICQPIWRRAKPAVTGRRQCDCQVPPSSPSASCNPVNMMGPERAPIFPLRPP
ncbi:hypothetical protein BS17DRAFT_422041 [Gyrodon lividus]|nr:hypothetical protein BS17DRAFT_422041 [Gyrodon lividus]